MIIELSYWDMFWLGVMVGWVLCWYVPKMLAIKVSNNSSFDRPNYIEPTKFEYKTPNYFKNVPIKEFKLHNQGEFPNKPQSEMPPLKKPKKSPPLPEYNPDK